MPHLKFSYSLPAFRLLRLFRVCFPDAFVLRILQPSNQPDGSGFHAGALGARLRRDEYRGAPLVGWRSELVAATTADECGFS